MGNHNNNLGEDHSHSAYTITNTIPLPIQYTTHPTHYPIHSTWYTVPSKESLASDQGGVRGNRVCVSVYI